MQFELPSGQLFEVFNSRSRYYQFHNCPVIGFQVEDVRAAKQEMEARGTEFVTEVFVDTSEAWAYFRGPDGYLYEIWHTDRMETNCRVRVIGRVAHSSPLVA